MKALSRYVLLVAFGGFAGRAQADGKFFAEKVPAGIPYQRAFILFHESSEILVLQSKYELSQSASIGSLGWVVPVPTVPEVGSANYAEGFFRTVYSHTRPMIFEISRIFLIIPLFFRGAGGRDVEIIKAEKAGIYDVKVIRSDSTDAILGWLKENGFGFSDADAEVFKDYIDRQWCFVVAKVEPDQQAETRRIAANRMVAPLVLKFETDKPVYPLALTSTIGVDTEILLYTLSERKLICGKQLTLRSARSTSTASLIGSLHYVAEPRTFGYFTNIPKSMILCKFKKKLKPEEMSRDLQFEFAPDNEPRVETIIVW